MPNEIQRKMSIIQDCHEFHVEWVYAIGEERESRRGIEELQSTFGSILFCSL